MPAKLTPPGERAARLWPELAGGGRGMTQRRIDVVEKALAAAQAEALEVAAQIAERLEDLLPTATLIPETIRALKETE